MASKSDMDVESEDEDNNVSLIPHTSKKKRHII